MLLGPDFHILKLRILQALHTVDHGSDLSDQS